jgi:hypothetical protein
LESTQAWVERAVIGLGLCPFAFEAWAGDRVRIIVSPARSVEDLAQALGHELFRLSQADPDQLETTLIVHPDVLGDFLEFNDFLELADAVLEAMGLDGAIQVASFHPDYRFADVPSDYPANCTNRSPYPTLHLLREASIKRAVAAYGDTSAIYERNIRKMRRIGEDGWRAAQKKAR